MKPASRLTPYASRSHWGWDLLDSAIQWGLMAVLAFAPLAFGAVHSWAYGIVWGTLWVLVALWGVRAWLSPRVASGGWEIQWIQCPFQPCLILFGLWVLFQTLPLPISWLGWIQPRSVEPHALAAPLAGGVPSTMPISLYLHGTWVGIFHLWSYGALFYLALYHLRSRRDLIRMAILWAALGSFEAMYGLVEFLGGTHRIWWWTNPWGVGSVNGTFINRDHLAGYLEMTLLVSLGMLLSLRAEMREDPRLGWRGKLSRIARDDRWARGLLVSFLCVVMGAALLLSLSRGGAMALTVVLLPLSLLLLSREATRRYGIIGLVVFAGMILYAAPLGLEGLLRRFSRLEEDLAARQALWGSTWDMVVAFPSAGAGWGTYEWIVPRFKPEAFGESIIDHAHNDWAELWAETGLLGSGIVLAGVVLYLLAGFRIWKERREGWAVWLGFGALATVVVVGGHGFGEFLLHTQANALTLAGVMAWGWVVLNHDMREKNGKALRWPLRRIRLPGWVRPLVVLLLGGAHLLLGWEMMKHLLAEFKVPTERNSTVVAGEVRDPDLIRAAIDLEPDNAQRWAALAREVLSKGLSPQGRAWAEAKGIGARGESPGDDMGWARGFLGRAIRMNPTDPRHYAQMGWILASRPQWRKEGLAEYALRAAVRLEPTNGLHLFHLGHYLLLDGRTQEARRAMEEAVRLSPRLRGDAERDWALFKRKKS